MTGLFSEREMNPISGADGAFYNNPIQMWYQLAGILTAIGLLKFYMKLFSILFYLFFF